MPRNPNDAPSQVGGQSSSSTSDQPGQQAQAPQPTDINVAASSDASAVKPAEATQVAASSMG
jgi:hypothetical protein